MKVKELTVKLPQLKPRDPNHLTLAAKKNAGGPMKDKKVAMKRGDFKHKGRAYEDMDLVEASLGSRMEYTDYDQWKKALPSKATITTNNGKERAQAVGKDFEGVAGTWDHETDSGWIYEYYLEKSNLIESKAAKQPITPENVLAAMPGNWSDILMQMGWNIDVSGEKRKALRQKIQPVLDALKKDGKVRTTSYPAEDDVYYAKKAAR